MVTGHGHEIEVFRTLRKSVFGPLASLGVISMGSSFCYSEKLEPCGAWMETKVLFEDNLAPFSSDKI